MLDTPAETAAKQVGWSMETQTSIDLDVTTITTRFGDNAKVSPAFTTITEHYIETAAGQRFLEFRGSKASSVVVRSVHYGDQGKFTDVNYRMNDTENQASIFVTNHFWQEDGSDRRQVPPPLLFNYVGHMPLNQALPKAQYLGTGKTLDRECELFLFTQVRWSVPQDQVFSLDKKTSVPLKVESFRDQAAREKGQPLAVWKAKTLDLVQGYYIPLKSASTAFNNDGTMAFTWDFDVTRIKFNDEFPASTFLPVFQPGVAVLDGTTKKMYQTPVAGKVASPALKVSTPATDKVVQAVPPGDWSGGIALGSLGLGAILLVVGISIWWRRR